MKRFQPSCSSTRREFLATSLSAAAMTLTCGTVAPAATSQAKIGCSTVAFRKVPLEEALKRIRKAGYEYFETQATGPWCPHVDVKKDDPQKFRRLVADFGFKGVTGLWSGLNADAIQWAGEAGIGVVNGGDGWKPKGMSDDDFLKRVGERLAPVLEVAEKSKVYMAIEPHGTFSLTAEGLKRLMGLSPSKWLGINYDTANVQHAFAAAAHPKPGREPFGKLQDEVATLQAVVDRVVHTHVKDTVGAKCVAIGKGEVNVRGCLQVLKAHGYTGVFSLETEGEYGADETQPLVEASYAFLVNALAT